MASQAIALRMIRAVQARDARKRFREIAPVLNERSLRCFIAMEARALDDLSWTFRHSRECLCSPGRIRKPGGGRKKEIIWGPTLMDDLKRLAREPRPGSLRPRKQLPTP